MIAHVYTFQLDLDWELVSRLNLIDKFEGKWNSIEQVEKRNLQELKSVATIESVGASTRIEGSKLSNEEVDYFIQSLSVQKLSERDQQEVAGYYEVLERITSSYNDIPVSESSIKALHKQMLQFSTKDEWHRGNYKQHPNHVEATLPDGSKHIIFQTTPPGYVTESAMRDLLHWYNSESQEHLLVKCAVFVYEFLSIHPFQDGNGRLSRLLTTLLLLKNGYHWIQYISFEHDIENHKSEYYSTLRSCQSGRPNEDVSMWVSFFLNCMITLQNKLLLKLSSTSIESALSSREKSILMLIRERPGIQSGEIASRLGIPSPSVKRLLTNLLKLNLLEKKGVGRAVSYVVRGYLL